MSAATQRVPVIDFESNGFGRASRLDTHPKGSAAVACPRVLLVGRNGSWGSAVLSPLEKLGSELHLAPPETVTPEYVRTAEFDVVLLDSTVSAEHRKELVSRLIGSAASVFYAFPVENGCWWLPALLRGQDCHGAPAFRRKEFPFELERVLREQTAA